MHDENPVADGGVAPVKPPLSRWAVASVVCGLATAGLAPFCSGSQHPAPQAVAALGAIVAGTVSLVWICTSRGTLRGRAWAVIGVLIALVAFSATPRFHMVRKSSVASMMRNDARQIAAAAQQYLIEYGSESVAFVYDPATGEVGPPLDAYVRRLTKSYAPVTERLTKTGTFQLGHPKIGVSTFSAEGRLVEATPGR